MSERKPPAKKQKTTAKVVVVELTPTEQTVVKIQFLKDNDPSSTGRTRFDDILQEYCRFMQLKVDYQNDDDDDDGSNTQLAPSYWVDKMWHAHILSTKEYLNFCDRYNNNNDGRNNYIHHDPALKQGQARYQLTLKHYKETFGEKATERDPEIWPENVDEKPHEVARPVKQEASDAAAKQEDESSKQESAAAGCGAAVKKEVKKEEPPEDESEDDSDDESSSEESSSDDDDDEDPEDQEIQAYLEEFGDERGTTEEELAEWHIAAARREGIDGEGTVNCESEHVWVKGEFCLRCDSCREGSRETGGFVCG